MIKMLSMNRLEFLLLGLVFLVLLLPYNTPYTPFAYTKEDEIVREQIQKEARDETILFLGDVMLGRFVETKMRAFGDEYPFKKLETFLASSTYVIANLEGPIPEKHVQTPNGEFRFSFKKTVAPLLAKMNIGYVSLANNHTEDWGVNNLLHTKSTLTNAGVIAFGASNQTLEEVALVPSEGLPTVVMGINSVSSSWDEEKAIMATKKIREKYPLDYFIIFMHWGEEYTHKQNKYQRAFAMRLIDEARVDAIIGTHPHVVQGIELYNGKPIFYSLGNTIFDQYFSRAVQDGYVLQLRGGEGFVDYVIYPIVSLNSQPSFAEGKDVLRILSEISNYSSKDLHTSIMRGGIRVKR
jgi:poly-gamma-glutamate synthesis protein (capsule biosynthesis protein)